MIISSLREAHPQGVTVYNLSVAGDRTYFVADESGNAVWVHNTYGLRLAKSLVLQKQFTAQARKSAEVATRFLRVSKSPLAAYYRALPANSPFGDVIKGRIVDRLMKQYFRKAYGKVPGALVDEAIKGSGGLRPDLFLPNVNGLRVVFDVGGYGKAKQIVKYQPFADLVIAVIWKI